MDKINSFLKKALFIGIIIFLIRRTMIDAATVYDLYGCISESVTASLIVMYFYEKTLWRYNVFENTPRLKERYSGKIKYRYNGISGEKNIDFSVKQSLFTVKVEIKTDEIISDSIVSELVNENGQHVLYYTYITTPKSEYSDLNPIQYGTSRLVLCDDGRLEGIYWTSRNTKGDIYLE